MFYIASSFNLVYAVVLLLTGSLKVKAKVKLRPVRCYLIVVYLDYHFRKGNERLYKGVTRWSELGSRRVDSGE